MGHLEAMLIELQIGVYHHVTGVDASSSASLAAYINTLTYKENHQSTSKIVQGVYWLGSRPFDRAAANVSTAVTMHSRDSTCACMLPFLAALIAIA